MPKLPLSARACAVCVGECKHHLAYAEDMHGNKMSIEQVVRECLDLSEGVAMRRKYDFNLRGAFVLVILTACVVGAVIAGCYGIWMLAR